MTMPEARAYWRMAPECSDATTSSDRSLEFPPGAAQPDPDLSRRDFLKLLGASAALATACTRLPRERILPYTNPPPEVTPGVALHYATAMTLDGYATGLLVESHEGRPTKIEGNPDHPASLGAAGVYEQASVLGLYDPDRASGVRFARRPGSWAHVVAALEPRALRARVGDRGAGLHLLLEPTSSPLVAALLARVRTTYPDAGIHFHAPLAVENPLEAARATMGAPLAPLYDLTRADVVVALDTDVLAGGPFALRYARDFSQHRRIAAPSDSMNRLYVVEPAPTPTGSLADHRLRARSSEIAGIAAGLLARVLAQGSTNTARSATLEHALANAASDAHAPWLDAVARDLRAAAGRSAVIVGAHQPPVVHAMASAVNAALGNTGATVWYVRSPVTAVEDAIGRAHRGLETLTDAMQTRAATAVVILEGNPVYTTPADLTFSLALHQTPQSFYLGLHENETALACSSFVPAAHYLESWGDTRAYDGTLSFVQPLIAPLYDGKTVSEVLAVLAGAPGDAHTLLRAEWRGGDPAWDEMLRRGLEPGSAFPRTAPPTRPDALEPMLATIQGTPRAGIEIVFKPDAAVYDGRFANNAWLEEVPRPLTTLTWGNAALLSPTTAANLSVATGDVLRIDVADRSVEVPALVVPGHADGAATIHVGYGRRGAERVARDVGVDVYPVRTQAAPWVAFATVTRARQGGHPLTRPLALTQTHWSLEGRPIIRQATLDEYRHDPEFTAKQRRRMLTVYEPRVERGDQWAMTVDLSLCTGCSACVVACQAENNVPVVGEAGVRESREMHWLRIDRYYTGSAADPEMIAQPMLCQHCGQAPCEYVCPVNATVHSDDGLNEMVYNRCVGTRFCSNNCPYKVRRFNWFDYNGDLEPPELLVKNPDVTVRDRGVMEKCTFCVQRIRRAQIDAQLEGRPLRDGDVVTACQQACPTQAIVFGSRTDPDATVTQRLDEPRGYSVLHDLGTDPRVRYLARITNPNPDLGPST